MLVFYIKTKCQDSIVWMIEISKNLVKTAKLFVGPENGKKLIHRNPNGPTSGRFGAAQHQAAILVETASQKTMDCPGVGVALSLFVLEFVHFAEHLDRNPDVIVGKPIDGMGVVQQDIGIENVILNVTATTVPRWSGKNDRRTGFVKQPRLIFGVHLFNNNLTTTAAAGSAGMSARGIRICGTGDQPEPPRDDSSHRLPCFRIVGERCVIHALLDFKPPNRD